MSEEQYRRFKEFLERRILESKSNWRENDAYKDVLNALLALKHGWPSAP